MKSFWVSVLDLYELPTDSRDVLVVLENEAQAELLKQHNRTLSLETELDELKKILRSHCADQVQIEKHNELEE